MGNFTCFSGYKPLSSICKNVLLVNAKSIKCKKAESAFCHFSGEVILCLIFFVLFCFEYLAHSFHENTNMCISDFHFSLSCGYLYAFSIYRNLNSPEMSVTTFLHSHDEMSLDSRADIGSV